VPFRRSSRREGEGKAEWGKDTGRGEKSYKTVCATGKTRTKRSAAAKSEANPGEPDGEGLTTKKNHKLENTDSASPLVGESRTFGRKAKREKFFGELKSKTLLGPGWHVLDERGKPLPPNTLRVHW